MKRACLVKRSTTTLIAAKTFRVGELLDKIHRDRFLWTERNRELMEKAIWFMSFCF
jgi:hypothetical protein